MKRLYRIGIITGTIWLTLLLLSSCSAGREKRESGPQSWIRGFRSASGHSMITSIAESNDGYIYAAGYITGSGEYTLSGEPGSPVTIQGGNGNSKESPLLAKYNRQGELIWALTTVSSPKGCRFTSLSCTGDGIYGAGFILGKDSYDFGNEVKVKGIGNSYTFVLVKYDSSGTPLWARTPISGVDNSRFNSIAAGPDGSIYAAGLVTGTGELRLDSRVPVRGAFRQNASTLLVKYSPEGSVIWARTPLKSPSISLFNTVVVDSEGSAYAGGEFYTDNQFEFGGPAVVKGPYNMGTNMLIVKYSSEGEPLWGRSALEAYNESKIHSLALAPTGELYAGGQITGYSPVNLGNDVRTGGGHINNNIFISKYDSSGSPLWASSVRQASMSSLLSSITVSPEGSLYAAGYLNGSSNYIFSENMVIKGSYSGSKELSLNSLILQYTPDGQIVWAGTTSESGGRSSFTTVLAGRGGELYTAGYTYNTEPYSFDNRLSIEGIYPGFNPMIMRLK